MVKKVTQVEKTVCDICGNDATYVCALCKKDICLEHARCLTKKTPRVQYGQVSSEWLPHPMTENYKELMTLCTDCCKEKLGV